ncbi:hypothetical protein [Vibrio splendidus]|nr:hypothetical protein [Vibrio splendidus]
MMSNPFYLCEVPTDYYSNRIESNRIESRKGMTWLDLAPTSGLKTWGGG